MAVPKKVAQRISSALRRFQPIIGSAKARDCNESDTAIVVTDILSELFGYDKYSDITSEHAIRGTYCDLALKVEGRLRILIEVKAIGTDFRDSRVKQAVDYAANQGVDWVVLTNAAEWRLYKVTFGKPVEAQQVGEFDMLALGPSDEADIEALYRLSKEGVAKNALDEYVCYRQATSRHLMAALILDDSIVQAIRRELRRITPDVRVDAADIRHKLTTEVLKRETLEGDEADQAQRVVAKSKKQSLRQTRKRTSAGSTEPELSPPPESAEPGAGCVPRGEPPEADDIASPTGTA